MTSLPDMLSAAWQLYQSGRLADAEQACRDVVARDPAAADAWFMLAVVLRGRGDLAAAADAYRETLRVRPDFPEALNNLGNLQLPVLMDRGRLLQVFRNLIENAIQHSPSGATVSVDARQMKEGSESWVECAIADSGTGFQPEDLPRVFDPFFTKRRGGTGLGLSIVQRIVEEHKGLIRLGNRNGSGALVKVRLPLFNGTNGNP